MSDRAGVLWARSGTFAGGVVHTLPFLIPSYLTAPAVAAGVVAFELVALVYLRHRFFATPFARSLAAIALGGVPFASSSAALGSLRDRESASPDQLSFWSPPDGYSGFDRQDDDS